MSNRNKYDFSLDLNNPIMAYLVEQIRPGSVILEFGPAMGRLTRYMKSHMECLVYIVELDEAAYEESKRYAEKGVCGDIESVQWEKEFSGVKFDYIIFGDVLEHLKNPVQTLKRTLDLMKDDGQVLGTVPNISYAGVVLELMQDKFRYRDIGILDDTHLRFFTRENIETMLKESDLVPVIIKGFSNSVAHSEFSDFLGNLPAGVEEFLQDLPWGGYYQYLFVAVKEMFYSKNNNLIKTEIERADNVKFQSFIYYDNGQGFNEEQKLSTVLTPSGEGSVTFRLPKAENILTLRWDPVFGRKVQCSNVYLINGDSIIKPLSSNSGKHLDGTDYFLDESAQYLFDLGNAKMSSITIHFNISVIYDMGTNIELERDLLNRISEKDRQICEEAALFKSKNEESRLTIENLSRQVEENRTAIVSLKDEAEQNRLAAESFKRETEENRLTAESFKNKAEENRLVAESFKREAEKNRLTAEYLKQEAEVLERERRFLDNKNTYLQNTVFKSAEAIHQNATEAQQVITALHGEIAALHNRLAQETAELSAVLSTKSWRITRPLRDFYTLMKKNRLARFLYFKIKKPPVPPASQIPSVVPGEKERMNEPLQLTPVLRNREKPSSVEETVSFIIPTYNGGTDFKRLMSHLRAQKGLDKIEIIVVDSGSSDETPEIAEYLGARVARITQEEFSHSYSRNLGAELAQGEYLFFITQDAMPTGRWWARNILEPLLTGRAVAATCSEQARPDTELYYKVCSFAHNSFMELIECDRIGSMPSEQDYTSLRKNAQLSNVTSAVCADVFYRYRFRGEYGEDLDLGMRLIRDGYRLAFLSTEKVIHSHNRPVMYFFKRAIVDNVFLYKLFPNMPKPEFDKNGLINYLAQGYRQIKKLRLVRFQEGVIPAYLFKIQMEVQLFALGDCDVDMPADDKILVFDKAITELLRDFPDSTQTSNDMITELINYFRSSVMPCLMRENEIVSQKETEEVIDCFYKYFAVAAGCAISAYMTKNPRADEIHAFAKKYMDGV